MNNRSYRMATICPAGMSQALKDYLAGPSAEGDTRMAMRDAIALRLLAPFADSALPFCCTAVGWAAKSTAPQLLHAKLSLLNELTVSTSRDKVSTEGFVHNLAEGTIQLVGVYPLLDADGADVRAEYERVSFGHNKETTDQLFEWSYAALLRRALRSDDLGIVIAVLAQSDALAESKAREAISLLGAAGDGKPRTSTGRPASPP